MRKTTFALLLLAGLCFVEKPALAAQYRDIDALLQPISGAAPVSGVLDLINLEGDSYTVGLYSSTDFGTISDEPLGPPGPSGFAGGAFQGVVTLFLSDPQGEGDESFLLVLDFPVAGTLPTDFNTLAFPFPFDENSFVGMLLLDSINDDGRLNYTLSATTGDFQIDYIVLEVDVRAAQSMPDGGVTAFLLGTAFFGLYGWRLRRKI